MFTNHNVVELFYLFHPHQLPSAELHYNLVHLGSFISQFVCIALSFYLPITYCMSSGIKVDAHFNYGQTCEGEF